MAKQHGLTTTRGPSAPPEISALVEKFAEHHETYCQPGYNETQLRQDCLDPFFVELGWDVYNRQGIHENYRDVILDFFVLSRGRCCKQQLA
jgi:predicted type IV restriction endonuclease